MMALSILIWAIGKRRTARLMRENGMQAQQKRRFKRPTDSDHHWPVARMKA
jgi:putative transposase